MINSLGASGGAEHGLVREIPRFSRGIDQIVVRLFEKDQLDGKLAGQGIEVVPLGLAGSRAGWNWPAAAARLAGVVSDFDPDVIHSSLFTANLVAQIAGRRCGLPVVSTFTLSGDTTLLKRFQPGAGSWKGSVLRVVARQAARYRAIRFRALTQDALDTNCRQLGVDPTRAVVIPRGVPRDLRPEVRKARSELGVPEGMPLLVNVGRQVAQKGHLALLKAFRLIRREVDAHLVIIGREGDASPEIRSAIEELGLGGGVSLAGYSPDVFHYLDHASVFVFSSYMEGLGTAVIEAMSLGLPIVAFDIPPVREVSDDGRLAHLVPVDDIVSFAQGVLGYLRAGQIRNDAGAEWVATNYSLDSVASRLELLLEKAASRG